jgi:tetratricopeptide (TPR) repeat protein
MFVTHGETRVVPRPTLIGSSPPMTDLRIIIDQVADTDCTILIFGESGCGKEVVARTLHQQSGRRGPFVAVNCGAIPASLLESELFGHERGAFTHAISNHIGRFEQADGGTLFLDEIAEMRPDLQVKLLRAIQERAFERVGGVQTIRVNVRILSATNQDLEEAMRAGRFRADLFYRLNVISIHVPPLRQRRNDIALLADHIMARLRQYRGYQVERIAPQALELLQRYRWPGNVRELENLLERALVLKKRGCLEVEDFPAYLQETSSQFSRHEPASRDVHSVQCTYRLPPESITVPAQVASLSVAPAVGPEVGTDGDRSRFFQLNMTAVNACLRGAKKQTVAVLFMAVLLAVGAAPTWGSSVQLESRAESQATHWLGRALPDSGEGSDQLRRGVQLFEGQQFQQALESFTEARRLGTGSAVEEAAVFLGAETQARAGTHAQDIRAAIIALEEARRRYPESPRTAWALWRIGSLHRQLGLDHEALARFEQFVRQQPGISPLMPFVRLDLADLYTAQGRYAAAARTLRYVREHPPDPDSLGLATVGLGDLSHALGQYRQAREFYEIAEAQWPELVRSRPVSLFGMGDTFLRLRHWPRALQLLNTGYALYPRDPIAALMLVRIADGLKLGGQVQQAKDLYRTAVERHIGTEGELLALLGLGELVEAEAIAGASESEVQQTYGAVIGRWSTRPEAAEALYHLGQSYQRAGQIELAAASYDDLLQRVDSKPWRAAGRQALETILRSLSAIGKTVEVANLFFRHENLLTTPHVDGPTGLVVAGALARLELIDPAIVLMQASLSARIPPVQHEYGLVGLAEAYRKKGEQAKLESIWTEYLRKYPNGSWVSDAQDGLIVAFSRLGKLKEGGQACHARLSGGRDTVHLDIKIACADLFVAGGQPVAAEALYRELLKVDSDDEDAAWASYQIAHALEVSKRSGEATEFLGRVARNGKDPLLAAVATVQLSNGPPEKP